MSHCNITMRNRHSLEWSEYHNRKMLEARLQVMEMHLQDTESNLKSIFDRVRAGEEVYLDYEDGTRIYLVAREES